jgi:hypothetical protein
VFGLCVPLAQATFLSYAVRFTTDVLTLKDAILQPLLEQCELVGSPHADSIAGLLSGVEALLEACHSAEQAFFAGTAQHFMSLSVCEVVHSTLPILVSALKVFIRWLRKAFPGFFSSGACVLPSVPLVPAHNWSTMDFILHPACLLVDLTAIAERTVRWVERCSAKNTCARV